MLNCNKVPMGGRRKKQPFGKEKENTPHIFLLCDFIYQELGK